MKLFKYNTTYTDAYKFFLVTSDFRMFDIIYNKSKKSTQTKYLGKCTSSSIPKIDGILLSNIPNYLKTLIFQLQDKKWWPKDKHHIKKENVPGLVEASKPFNNFNIVGSIQDPVVPETFMYLLRFHPDGEYGLCIYNTHLKKFLEEPSDLEDYNTDLTKLRIKYNLYDKTL